MLRIPYTVPMVERAIRAGTEIPAARRAPATVPRLPRPRLAVLILSSAVWGMIVDGNFIPLLAPTGNSTIIQATTAASFAVLGIVFGPFAGALGGLIRDGSSFVITLAAHPHMIVEPGLLQWCGRKTADVFEDVVLGWVPGLVGLRTRRLTPLALTVFVTTWLSLPFLVVANPLVDGHAGSVWHALTTPIGDWDEPVDPGLAVYALLAAALTCAVLAPLISHPRRSVAVGLLFVSPGVLLMLLGAHP